MNRPGPTPGAVTGTTSTRSSSAESWPLRGACRDADPELFFTPEGERGTMREYREADAKAVCAGCPVLAECRASALEERIPYGVWGGLSEADRIDELAASPGGAVTRSASSAQRERRRAAVLEELVELAAEGYSRDEVIVTLRVAGNWLTRICNDAGRARIGDVLLYGTTHAAIVAAVSRGRVTLTVVARHSGTLVTTQRPYAAYTVRAVLT